MIIFVLPGLNGGTFLYYNGGSFPNTKTRVDPVREQWSSSRQAYQYNCNSNILTDIRRGVAIHRRTQYHLSRNGAALRLVCSVLVFSSRIRVLLYSSITSSVQSLVATSKTNCTLVLHRAYKVWWLCLKQTACTLEGKFFRRLVDCFRADWAPHRRSHAGCLLEPYPSGQISLVVMSKTNCLYSRG